MKIVAIWAQDNNGALGNGKGMSWSVPDDFKHFKLSTIGCPIIMGRNSFDALSVPLPKRENIVITSQKTYGDDKNFPNLHIVYSIEESVELAKKIAKENNVDIIWIAGGSQIYKQFMNLCDELVVSYLDLVAEDENLVYAPEIDENIWEEDTVRSDHNWREPSGDVQRWKIKYFVKKKHNKIIKHIYNNL